MDDDTKLLLAFSIGEWATALEHLGALVKLGTAGPVPGVTISRSRRELALLCVRWMREEGLPLDDLDRDTLVDAVVVQARAYCTLHMTRLDELVREREQV